MVGMSNEQKDDRFERWVREAASDYNRPPDIPPRDAMWDEIAARHSALDPRHSSETRHLALGTQALMGPRRVALALWPLAAAAMLLIAAGVGIGYWMRGGTPDRVASHAPSGDSATAPVVPGGAVRSRDSVSAAAPNAVATTPRPAKAGNAASNVDTGENGTSGYDLLATQHLNAAELLLTSFRADRDTVVQDAMRRWARDLLSTTRLLIDSPAGKDATRRRLLEDLELILVQMSQTSSQGDALDRELIDRAITRRQVLTRIRNSIPASTSRGT
jgi:hypothetical protein